MSSTVERQILDFGGGLPRTAAGAPESSYEPRDGDGRFSSTLPRLNSRAGYRSWARTNGV